MRALFVALGAGIGAPARYLTDQAIKNMHSRVMPLETLFINVLGSFVLGLVINSGQNALLIVGTGFAGAFTTWSTFAVETHELFEKKERVQAWGYLFLTLVLGVAAAAAGNAL